MAVLVCGCLPGDLPCRVFCLVASPTSGQKCTPIACALLPHPAGYCLPARLPCPPACLPQVSAAMRTLITRGFAICPTLLVALSAKDDGTQVPACLLARLRACLPCPAPIMCQQRRHGHVARGCYTAPNTACLLSACLPACSWTRSTSGSTSCRACSCPLPSFR